MRWLAGNGGEIVYVARLIGALPLTMHGLNSSSFIHQFFLDGVLGIGGLFCRDSVTQNPLFLNLALYHISFLA